VIFVDDLDRCMGQVAFRFLEAMKIYFSISNCVFVLGLDVRHVRRAVAAELKKAGVIPDDGKSEIYASDYLSKIFQNVFYLPYLTDYQDYLKFLMSESGLEDAGEWIEMMISSEILPPNPRKIKAFVSGLVFYVNQLKSRLQGDEVLDKRLTLIFTYLRFNANEVYRILEAEKDFWRQIAAFCKIGENEQTHPALKKLNLPQKLKKSPDTSEAVEDVYESTYPDPADESLFRAARLIREWHKDHEGGVPSDNEFTLYLLGRR
jgi:hypothetical protein